MRLVGPVLDAATRDPPDHDLAQPGPPLAYAPVRAEDVVVGRDQPGHHGLAQPAAGVDHDLVPGTGDRVGREQHARERGRHHLLHDDRDAHPGRVEVAPCPVGDGPLRPQRSPAAAHRVEQRVRADDVEVGVLLPGERGAGQVLRRGAGPDGHRALTQQGVGAEDRPAHLVGDVGGGEGRPQRGTGVLGRGGQGRPQAGVFDDRGVRVGGDDGAVGDREPGADQLAEVGSLAARRREVVAADVAERVYEPGGVAGRGVGHQAIPSSGRASGRAYVRGLAQRPGG